MTNSSTLLSVWFLEYSTTVWHSHQNTTVGSAPARTPPRGSTPQGDYRISMAEPRTPGNHTQLDRDPRDRLHSTTNTQHQVYFDLSTLLLPLIVPSAGPLIMPNQCQDCHPSKSGEYYANYESLTFQVNPIQL